MLALLLLAAAPARAGDVLVPTFTPRTVSDFRVSEEVTEATLEALADAGVPFVPPSEIRDRAGEVAEGCAEEPRCTELLFARFPPASVAVVGMVGWQEGELAAVVRFYTPDDPSPVEVLTRSFPPEATAEFALSVASTARDLVGLVPAREPAPIAAAREPPSPEPPPAPPEPAPAPAAAAEEASPPPPAGRGASGLPARLLARYRESGLDWAEWREAALVRAGSVVVELTAGYALGDVDRRYDTRVALEQVGQQFERRGTYQYDSFVPGEGWVLGAAVGWLPTWWLELGVGGALLLAHKELDTGWEHYVQDDDGDWTLHAADAATYPAVQAQLGLVEPRLRLYLLPSGPAKPFLLAGGQFRFYDGYVVPDLENVDYPDRPGGMGAGVEAGGGLAIDVPGGMVGVVEVPWALLLSPEPYMRGGDGISDVPEAEAPSRHLLQFRAGLGVRL